MMTALNRSRPQFSNTTRLKVSPSSRWPMTSVFCEIGRLPKWPPIGCLSFCLTLTVIAKRDGCTCPHEVGNCLEHNAFRYFDHTWNTLEKGGDLCNPHGDSPVADTADFTASASRFTPRV